MTGNNRKKGNGKRASDSKNGSIQVRSRVPKYDKYQRFTRIPENNNNGIKFGTILVIAVLAGLAAILSSLGNATIDQLNFTGQPAADVWWTIMGIAAIIGSFLAIADLLTRGKY
ncbi:MAG: hypothetical protein ACYCT2_04445 [Thermoplasmataceae archaeon]